MPSECSDVDQSAQSWSLDKAYAGEMHTLPDIGCALVKLHTFFTMAVNSAGTQWSTMHCSFATLLQPEPQHCVTNSVNCSGLIGATQTLFPMARLRSCSELALHQIQQWIGCFYRVICPSKQNLNAPGPPHASCMQPGHAAPMPGHGSVHRPVSSVQLMCQSDLVLWPL